MPAVAKLLAGSPLPDRSMVMTQTKRDTPTPKCYVWLAVIRAEGVNGTWVMCL
jgi:hypothetical protein